jgi:large subunit ribosomal protein L18e
MRTGPTNQELATLIERLKKQSIEKKVKFWKRIASDLSKSSRQRRIVNLLHISKNTKENDTIIVPGKVLGTGEIKHKVKIAAFGFSKSAVEKLNISGSQTLTINDLIEQNPEGKKVRIIG